MNMRLIMLLMLSALLLSCMEKKWDNPVDTIYHLSDKPVFSVQSGEYNNPISVAITCEQGRQIRYTTDGSIPTPESTIYTAPITLEGQAITLKAKSFADKNSGEVTSAAYTFRISNPVISLSTGTYNQTQTTTVTCTTIGTTIRYTTNGTEPTPSSTLYSDSIPINISTTLKVKAFKTGWNTSPTMSAVYTLMVATPVFSLAEGTYYQPQSTTITCATTGAAIRYTTNGSEPTASSALYSGSIPINVSTTLKAKAFKTNWPPSAIANADYTIADWTADNVLVAGGTFNNGTSNVTLSSFFISKYELTQGEYQAVMGSNPAHGYGIGNSYPVYFISWLNAIEYCNRRSIREDLTPCYSYSTYGTNPATWPGGWNSNSTNHTYVTCNWTANGYRLPTEAEWEFAARGGNSTHNYTYSGSNTIAGVAWYYFNSGSNTHVVGTKTANELGIFDMSGNVWEWIWDIYGTYANGAQTNPHGLMNGTYRVNRGGSWYYDAYSCNVAYRDCTVATASNYYIGFRCVRVSP